jgi:hypothetical protein
MGEDLVAVDVTCCNVGEIRGNRVSGHRVRSSQPEDVVSRTHRRFIEGLVNHQNVQVTSEFFVLRVVQGLEKGSLGVFPDKRKSRNPNRIPIQMQVQRLGPVKNIDVRQTVKEVKREFGALVIAGNDHHGNAGFGKPPEGLNQVIQPFPRNVKLIKKISAVDEQVHVTLKGMIYDFQEIPENRVRPSLPPQAVRRGDLEHFKPEMSVCGVNELQVVTRY